MTTLTQEDAVTEYINKVNENVNFNDYIKLAQEGGLEIESITNRGCVVTIKAYYLKNKNDLIENYYQGFCDKNSSTEELEELTQTAIEFYEPRCDAENEMEDIERNLRSGDLLFTLEEEEMELIERHASLIKDVTWEVEDRTDYEGILEEYIEGLES